MSEYAYERALQKPASWAATIVRGDTADCVVVYRTYIDLDYRPRHVKNPPDERDEALVGGNRADPSGYAVYCIREAAWEAVMDRGTARSAEAHP